ncbi:hypothetical protein [uncultured Clostridium sp.]|uniref:hypothetical protein n=1 Tax=uncultured Clostridium sp. TaxID=59620 RepID=UPI0026185ADB|nr:hypothetical protein [uncultured Clostridium sp.]
MKETRYIYIQLFIKPEYQDKYNKVRFVRYVDDGNVASKIYNNFIKKDGVFYTILLTKPYLPAIPIPVKYIKSYKIVNCDELKESLKYYLIQDTSEIIYKMINESFEQLKSNN